MSAAEVFKSHMTALFQRLDTVIKDKWPEVLGLELSPLEWGRIHLPESAKKCDRLFDEANQLWVNGQVSAFKTMLTDWGRAYLEVVKQYSAYLAQKEAA